MPSPSSGSWPTEQVFPGAVRAVYAGVRGYRLPEPARLAHGYVNEQRRQRLG